MTQRVGVLREGRGAGACTAPAKVVVFHMSFIFVLIRMGGVWRETVQDSRRDWDTFVVGVFVKW